MCATPEAGLPDHRQHTLAAAQHIVVPKAHHAIALTDEKCVSRNILCALRMLAAINFDNQTLSAYKINNERPNRFLAHELEPAEPTVTNSEPKFPLGVGLLAAEPTFDMNCSANRPSHSLGSSIRTQMPLTPPSPRKSGERE